MVVSSGVILRLACRDEDNAPAGGAEAPYSLFFQREANNPPQRLNALTGDRCI
jgi:hypothetical protein